MLCYSSCSVSAVCHKRALQAGPKAHLCGTPSFTPPLCNPSLLSPAPPKQPVYVVWHFKPVSGTLRQGLSRPKFVKLNGGEFDMSKKRICLDCIAHNSIIASCAQRLGQSAWGLCRLGICIGACKQLKAAQLRQPRTLYKPSACQNCSRPTTLMSQTSVCALSLQPP